MSTETHSTGDDRAARRRALLRRMLAERGLGPAEPEAAPTGHEARTGPTPLSAAQRRLWFLQQMEPDTPAYNLSCGIRIRGPVDTGVLERALARVVRDHPVLRTVYQEEAGDEPTQVVREDLSVPLRSHHLPPGEDSPEGWLRAVARSEARRPFRLTTEAPARAVLLRLAEDHHVLVVVVHHIAADDQTWGVLFPDLFRHYTALRAAPHASADVEESPTGPEGGTTYADYAVWERSRLAPDRIDRQLAHWRRVLTPAPAPLPLPADRVRDPGAGSEGADASMSVPGTVRDALVNVGRAAGATPFMALFAVYVVLLHRVTGAQDVCVGSPAVLRDSPELARLAGNFQNTLALRVDLSGDPSFTELLARVRQTCVDAYAHQEVPFERVVAELRPPRDVGRTPFFDTMFLTQEEAATGSTAPGLDLSEVPLHNGTTQFDLTLAVTPTGAELALTALYRPSLFDAGTIRALLDLYARLAAAVSEHPDTPLTRLPLVDDGERADAWARPSPATPVSAHRSLPEAFDATVSTHPDRVAVTSDGVSLTYGELSHRAERLARVLAGGGAAPGERVLLALPRGTDLITAMVAVTRTGAAYVPVDVEHPRARLATVAADAAPVLAVTDAQHASRLPRHLTVVAVDGDTVQGPAPVDPVRAPRPEDPCYVLYTSGSTGAPKGVVVPHRAVVRLMDSTDHWFGFDFEDVWTMFHSCAFDFSTWEVWGPLLTGGRMVIVPAATTRSPEDFLDLLERERVTILNQTPSAFWALDAADAERGPDLALRWVVLGGEALDPRRLRPWYARRGGDTPRLVNMYGITETTVHVTYQPLDAHTIHSDPGSPIGEPIPDLSLQLLDAAGHLVPPLVVGELHVGGAGVALGYLDRPRETAERFTALAGPPGADRRYRTGDLARRRADGTLEYLGRADSQIKVRGFRVEPAEIESALETHAHITRAAVTVVADQVAAHLVPAPGAEPDPAELRAHTMRTLPSHMVPSVFHTHESLPLTTSGKLDRARLADRATGRQLSAAVRRAAGSDTERAVADLWRELLDLPEVGGDDNFFDLGGHSLLLTRVRTELARRLDRHLPIAELYAHPTVRSLARYLDREEKPAPEPNAARDRAKHRRAALARHRDRPAGHRAVDGEDTTP